MVTKAATLAEIIIVFSGSECILFRPSFHLSELAGYANGKMCKLVFMVRWLTLASSVSSFGPSCHVACNLIKSVKQLSNKLCQSPC